MRSAICEETRQMDWSGGIGFLAIQVAAGVLIEVRARVGGAVQVADAESGRLLSGGGKSEKDEQD